MPDESHRLALGSFHCQPLARTFGVELAGPQLTDWLTEGEVPNVVRLLAQHSLLVFRGQELSEQDQDKITKMLGEQRDQGEHAWAPAPDPDAVIGDKNALFGFIPFLNKGGSLFFLNGPALCEDDPTAVLDASDDNLKGGSSCWHTGDTEKFSIEIANMLYPVVAPENKGHTLFSDTVAAFQDLPEDMQRSLEQLRVIHALTFPPDVAERFSIPPSTDPVSQPLVKQCSVTGRKFLYASFNFMDRIAGYSRADSYRTLKFLFHHLIQPKYIYEHKWLAGDLLLWNCNGTMHKRGELDPACQRVLRRTQIAIPALQSTRQWDKSQHPKPGDHNGEFWHPYPFEADPEVSVYSASLSSKDRPA